MYSGLLARFLFLFTGLFAVVQSLTAQSSTWTGAAGNESWTSPGNWSANVAPVAGAVVLLDNSSVPGSYRVQLPDVPVILQAIAIRPSPGQTIELLLPSSNTNNGALVLTGSGYPLLLGSGGIFRNACGISSGASIDLADSFRIENGGRYIHSTRGTHAASLLARLSSSPGTERGIFEFDVPRASYTISVSNRTYGTLALRSSAFGQPVNYTCSGSNPLLVRGDLDIGAGVSLSVDLATAKGNIVVLGDLLQQPGTLTLGSGEGDSTRLQLKGNFIQQEGAVLTSAAGAFPALVFGGFAEQVIAAAGSISGNVTVAVNNPAGVTLQEPLFISTALDLSSGTLFTSPGHLLTLGDTCILRVDSLIPGTYVDGPLCRRIVPGTAASLFPVGAAGVSRWLAVREGSGVFTARYFPENPATLAARTGSGIDHVSSKEYWYLQSSGASAGKVELSHAVPQSGTITDPAVLRVARLQENEWLDAGESAFTGDLVRGSVISNPVTDFSGNYFTLGSSLAIENPLPLESVFFKVWRDNGQIRFKWSWSGPDEATGFDIIQLENSGEKKVSYTVAHKSEADYTWTMPSPVPSVPTRWRIDLIDKQANHHPGKSVFLPANPASTREIFFTNQSVTGSQWLMVRTRQQGGCILQLYSVSGALVWQETKFCVKGENRWLLRGAPAGIYFLRLTFDDGQENTTRLLL